MKFPLMPISHASKQSSSDITTDFGAIHISLNWSPNPPRPGSESNLTLKFSDAQKDSSLNADVNYGLVIRSSDGKEIIRKDNLFALNGTGTVSLAIPVSGVIGGKGDISFTRLVPGRYLITDVKGGPATVDRALGALKDYIRDHQRTVMAIPFQSLITNRMQEPDSSKWVTKIYYPVM